ncbi:V-type proton ATPase subunit C 1-B isoform X3 [Corythoichthys intestinalis]|uniref:V-type proton ATPase subunit C 1-B isoform X3 n=1 Tax=Corythoichthys intestinalis TaxID=161448 RepID=UPI0025A5E2AE|nr:V-type proton ATPase subunit C 1-B isoform X3 [Corythoichthys intestinalis]
MEKCRENLPVRNRDKLVTTAKDRYVSNFKDVNNVDPHEQAEHKWNKDVDKLPPLREMDIMLYLVFGICYYTHQQFRNYKSLQCYEQFCCGWVQDLHFMTIANSNTIFLAKVGILDSLLIVSDDLSTLDTLTESVMNKTCQCIREMVEQACDSVMENVSANGAKGIKQRDLQYPASIKSLRVDMINYVTSFHWDKAKYPTSLPLSSLVNIIKKEVSQVEVELKSRVAAYSSVKANLLRLENKLEKNYGNWEKKYESLTNFVVPRSSRKLYEDGEGGIFTVTLFKRAVHEFKGKAQESNVVYNLHRFTVREYCFELEEKRQQARKELSVHRKEHYEMFARWLKVNYSQVFMAWIHLKALRVFVESVLRYGLPVNYQALLLHSDRKCSEKLRQELASLFMHLDPMATVSKTDVRHIIMHHCFLKHMQCNESNITFHLTVLRSGIPIQAPTFLCGIYINLLIPEIYGYILYIYLLTSFHDCIIYLQIYKYKNVLLNYFYLS